MMLPRSFLSCSLPIPTFRGVPHAFIACNFTSGHKSAPTAIKSSRRHFVRRFHIGTKVHLLHLQTNAIGRPEGGGNDGSPINEFHVPHFILRQTGKRVTRLHDGSEASAGGWTVAELKRLPGVVGLENSVRSSNGESDGKGYVWTFRNSRNSGKNVTDLPGATPQPQYALATTFHTPTVSAINRMIITIRGAIFAGFFPKDYPHSVKPQYFGFVAWGLLNNVVGTIMGVLSTQALMMALGFGAATSAGLSAGINWVIKDGIGQLGGVIYASVMNSKFDSEPKRIRWTSTILLHAATLLELLTPTFPHLFVLAASLSNIGKNIGWLALGASKAAIQKTMLVRDNLGDVTGKAGAQSTFAGLLGTALGVLISYAFPPTSPTALLGLFAPLSASSLFCIYMSSSTVVCETLNRQRGERIVRAWLESGAGVHQCQFNTAFSRVVPSPETVSSAETFLVQYQSLFPVPLELEPLIESRLPYIDVSSFEEMAMTGENYFVAVATGNDGRVGWWKRGERETTASTPTVCLWYSSTATPGDVIRGFYHACVLRWELEQRGGHIVKEECRKAEQQAREFVGSTAGQFIENLDEAGWSVDDEFLGEAGRRIEIIR